MTLNSIIIERSEFQSKLSYYIKQGYYKYAIPHIPHLTQDEVGKPDEDGRTALHHAGRYTTGIGTALIKRMKPEDIGRTDIHGRTALHYVMLSEDFPAFVKVLLKYLTDEDILKSDINDLTALFIAVREGHNDSAKLLIDRMSSRSVAAAIPDGYTPLYVACHQGNRKLILALTHKVGWQSVDQLNPKTKKTPFEILAENHPDLFTECQKLRAESSIKKLKPSEKTPVLINIPTKPPVQLARKYMRKSSSKTADKSLPEKTEQRSIQRKNKIVNT